jgi:YidC/Oxa1 family membrane protein insertase
MDKQTTIAFVLIGFILILWLFLNNPEPQPVKQSKDSTLVKQQAPDTTKKEKQVVSKTETQQDTSAFGKVFQPADAKEKIITIENSLVKLELNSVGAKLKRLFLKNYKTWYANGEKDNFYKNHVQLINPADSGDFNLMFITKEGKLVNTSHAAFTVEAIKPYYKLEEKDSLKISFALQVGNDSYIKKNYIIKGNDYALRCDVEMVNMEKYISNYRYDVLWANGINFVEKNSVDEANYSNASAFSGGEQAIVKASSKEKMNKEFNGKVDWLGIRNKYFAVLIAPQNPADEGGAYIEGRQKHIGDGIREIYNASLKVPFNNQSYQKNSFLLYLGPVDYDILKKHGKNFESIVDFGSFFGLKFIIRPISEYILLPLFKFLHLFIPNWGLVIIVFSLIIKVALHPLTRSQMKSMKKMQMLQPKITELKEKYKDDPQKMNKETMKLYSTYGINPAGGCLPLLLQMPILVALWGLFNVAIELRQASFVWWITNLSAPDVIFTLPFRIPIFGINQISALPLLLGITMFIQQKMTVKDPSQKMLVYLMPVMFTLMFMGFPSGLNLYYFMFNLFSIVQQYYVNHSHANVELVPVKNPKKSGGFMSRMMEAAEKQSQQQAAARKKK